MTARQRLADPRAPSLHKLITPPAGSMPSLNTSEIFKHEAAPEKLSPIDRFTVNCNGIARLIMEPRYLERREPVPSEMATIVILGYVSAVESYLRAILSNLITIDEYVQFVVERKTLTYGAVLHHKASLLPDALLEGTSFASRENIKDALKEFLRLQTVRMTGVEDALKSFQRICEVRHCCVHRFGRLGSNNAISLGLAEHSTLLEARVEPDIDLLQDVLLSMRVLVRVLNASVFTAIIERTAKQVVQDEKFPYTWPERWKWRWPTDRSRFLKYYNLFASNKDVAVSPGAKAIYDSFRREMKPST
jgi:hypothetical protein